jgi:hypothetical protein
MFRVARQYTGGCPMAEVMAEVCLRHARGNYFINSNSYSIQQPDNQAAIYVAYGH